MSNRKKRGSVCPRRKREKDRFWYYAVGIILLLLCHTGYNIYQNRFVSRYEQKMDALSGQVNLSNLELQEHPAGETAGYVVFLSVCDTSSRASVFCGTGDSIFVAWEAANEKTRTFIKENRYDTVWLKADIVFDSQVLSYEELSRQVYTVRHEFYRYGVAFDEAFETALLEQEMNGSKVYECVEGGISLDYLNLHLRRADKPELEGLPESMRIFQCLSWFQDEDGTVYELSHEGLAYGRRSAVVDRDYAEEIIMQASGFLEDQMLPDGSFIYGMYPRFDNDIDNYNIIRHVSTMWSLLCRYRLAPDEDLKAKIDAGVSYMMENIRYDEAGRAYLYEAKSDEIKLGGLGIAAVVLTEYMDVFETDIYTELACQIGDGILTFLNEETGCWYHVLNGDFSPKDEYRIIYYDGEATFGLCRLYGMSGDEKWLDAAKCSVNHFIEADYTQFKDHWVAYSMNELTKYVPDNQAYYDFAMENVSRNLDVIRERETTYHTYTELLMASFEVYDRMIQNGFSVDGFDVQEFLDTISVRVHRQLDGFFYPEYAMYMMNPARVLNTFMVRHDGYRIRIDDVQHNIGGYYLYYKNYEKLVEYGMRVVDEG